MPSVTKDLQAAIMNRGRLSNNFLKNRTNKNKILYTKQRNYCLDSQKIKKIKILTEMKRIYSAINFFEKLYNHHCLMKLVQINLSENDETVKTKLETVKVLLKILKFQSFLSMNLS